MISTTVKSQACRLLTCEPNSGGPSRLTVEIPVEEVRSLTGRTSRRPGAVLARYTQSWITLLELRKLVEGLAATVEAQGREIAALKRR